MIIREANNQDIPQLRSMEQGVIDYERPLNSSLTSEDTNYYDLSAMIADANTHLVVIEYHSELIGTGYAQIRESRDYFVHEHHAYIGFMYVSPDHRGKGLAQKILNRLLEWSESRGVSDFYLDVYEQNASAIKSYQKAGFVPNLLQMKLSR
ncbi:MAG: GNAT family N-acetyltransferase [Pseudomonadota bacterium]